MTQLRRFVASFLVMCMLGLSVPMQAHAGIVSTDQLTASAERERVGSMLNRADVQARLESMGVKPADVQARVDALSDQEVSQLAGQLDTLPAGGDGIIGALVFIFIVLLVTDLLGLTHIFPFTSRR
jgi:hypothetical protein